MNDMDNTPTPPRTWLPLRTWFEQRRAVRDRMESADQLIKHWEDRVRKTFPDLPPIEASRSDLDATSTSQMTVSTEWLAAMLDRVNQMGHVDEMDGMANELDD